MEAMQIVAPTFLQQIFVAGVEDLGCANTFFFWYSHCTEHATG